MVKYFDKSVSNSLFVFFFYIPLTNSYKLRSQLMEFKEKLEQACNNGLEAYKTFFLKLNSRTLASSEIKQIVWLLEDINDTDSIFVRDAANFQLSQLKGDQTESIAGSYYLMIAALVRLEDFAEIAALLRKALEICVLNENSHRYGVYICLNVQKHITENDLSQDTILLIYKLISDYYLAISAQAEAIELMLSCVSIFAGLNATQSAFRLVQNIENKLGERLTPHMKGQLYAALGTASVSEGDYEFAEDAFHKSFSAYEQAGEKIPRATLSNYATVLIRQNKPELALKIYDQLLLEKETLADEAWSFLAHYHKAICLKDMNKELQALRIYTSLEPVAEKIEKKLKVFYHIDLLEALVDYYISFSRLLAKRKKFSRSLDFLKKSIYIIEILLNTIFRPHFKRGIREKYNRRILTVTDMLTEELPTIKMIEVFCYLKKNSQSDWLSILNWINYIDMASGVPVEELQPIRLAFNQLASEGGVFMSSYKEKYDDPFQNPNLFELESMSTPENMLLWQEFEAQARKLIARFNLKGVYEANSVDKLAMLIRKKMKTGVIMLFCFFRSAGNVIYLISPLKRNIVAVPYDEIARNYIYSRGEYQQTGSKGDFFTSLLKYSDRIRDKISVLVEEICIPKIKAVYVFPSVMDASFPLIQSLFSDERVSSKCGEGKFFIQSCPLMYERKGGAGKFNKLAVLKNEQDKLDLFDEELIMLGKVFNRFEECATFNQISPDTDVAHLISHGNPISGFTDAAFSSLTENYLHLYSFTDISQTNLKLVYLNVCNGADTMNRNHQKIFSTHELTGYITASLQNPGVYTLGSQWPTLDMISYVYARIFYSFLNKENNIESAYSKTIWTMKNENKAFFTALLEEISDPLIRKRKLDSFYNAPERPFSNMFAYSGMLMYSLI